MCGQRGIGLEAADILAAKLARSMSSPLSSSICRSFRHCFVDLICVPSTQPHVAEDFMFQNWKNPALDSLTGCKSIDENTLFVAVPSF